MAQQPSSKKNKIRTGGNALDLLDEAYFLLRGNLLDIMPLHFLSAVPFVLGMLFFCYRFDNFHAVDTDIIKWSMLLTLLFCWKMFFEAVLSGKIMEIVSGGNNPESIFKHPGIVLLKQSLIQAFALIIILCLIKHPLIFMALIPVSIFMLPPLIYSTAAICAVAPGKGIRHLFRKIIFHIGRDFLQLMMIMFIVVIGTAVLTCNIYLALLLAPYLLKMFLGIESQFTLAGNMSIALFFNSTIWSIVIAASWLILDPFCRTLFVLRVFYGESSDRGWDITASLHHIRSNTAKALTIFIMLASPLVVNAGSPPPPAKPEAAAEISHKQIAESISETRGNLEFQWRTPGKQISDTQESWIWKYLSRALEYCGKKLGKLIEYIRDLFKKYFPEAPENKNLKSFLKGSWNILKYLVPVLLVIVISIIILRKALGKQKNKSAPLSSSKRRPDLTREDIAANELEEDEWLKLCRELLDQKEYKLALRAFYLGCICALAKRKLLLAARHKTDYEYLDELRRRAHTMPETIEIFTNNIITFQRVWYGNHSVSRELLDKYIEDSKILLSDNNSNRVNENGEVQIGQN
jgi:hypothetical protein